MSGEQEVPQQDGPLVWDMPKLKRWLEAGLDVSSVDVIDAYTLRRIESDGLIEINEVSARGRRYVSIDITALGEFEVDRLKALEAAATAGMVPQDQNDPTEVHGL